MKAGKLALFAFACALIFGGSEVRASDATRDAAIAVMENFLAAFNARDLEAWEATFHFPHVRIASGQATVLEAAGMRTPALFDQLAATGWHHSAWNYIDVIYAGDQKVHLDVEFTRFREDGSVLAAYRSLYIVTLQDGHWGIKARSSFAP